MASPSDAAGPALRRRNLYLATAVFCIVASVLSLALLIALLYGGSAVRAYAPFIITVHLGLAIVVIVALVQVVRAERAHRDATRNALDNRIAVRACPDYWTLQSKDRKCVNKYEPPRTPEQVATGVTVSYKILGDKASDIDKSVKLGDLDSKSLRQLCKTVDELNTPWSSLEPTCTAFSATA